MPRKYTPEQRIFAFWSKAALTANPDLCWEWQASLNSDGYGNFRVNHAVDKSHRIAWKLTYGEIPTNIEVCHTCDNPSCINPAHLFLGTHSDNMQDMNAKGRRNDACGERCPNHKLSDKQVAEIRERYALGGIRQQDLAVEYGVIQAHISRIVRRVNRV